MENEEKNVLIYTKDHQYSFDISEDSGNKISEDSKSNVDDSLKRRFYFTLKNKKPIKLGDGTYGIVYQVHDKNEYEFAVKLLYNQKDSNTLRSSYEQEMKSARTIRQKLRNQGEGRNFYGIIEIQGGTSQFKDSFVYEQFKDIFDDLRVSNYAVVMPKYNCTLKDILEERIVEQKNRVAGYSLIKSLPFDRRIEQIVPFLRSIAEGIKTLHEVEKFHLDLKPANIFINKLPASLEVVVGDLGFLNYESIKASTLLTVSDYIPLGTRHYRSPEQKDYFDICDVEIKLINLKNGKIELVIRDQKFQDTIIERGDRLIFSKLGSERIFHIHKFEKKDNYITIGIDKIKEDCDFLTKLIEKEITQVILYKYQKYRTDLFGIGAITFDMLTGGRCPERFYDSIRNYDKASEDATKIANLYNQVATLESDQPDLARLFQPFRKTEKSTQYAPREIVELILKCILYKAKNSYYNQAGENKRKAVQLVTKDLEKLESLYRGDVRINPLIISGIDPNETDPLEPESTLQDQLKKIQELSDESLFPARLLQGTGYFCKLVDLVAGIIRDNNDQSDDRFYFADLRPNNILISGNSSDNSSSSVSLKKSSYVYREYSKYKDELSKDYVYANIKNQYNDPFVPDEIAYMRREINLISCKHSKSNNEFSCQYSFFDKSSFGNCIEKGDWIIEQSDDIEHARLWEISSSSSNIITLKVDAKFSPNLTTNQSTVSIVESHEESKIDNSEQDLENETITSTSDYSVFCNNTKFIYYKKLDVCRYYFYMIGIYIYQIFFNGLNNIYDNNYRFLGLIKNRIYYYDKRNTDIEIVSKNKSRRNIPQNPSLILDQIFNQLVEMFLKLTVYEAKDSYYGNPNNRNDISRLLELNKDKDYLISLIKQFFDKTNYNFDTNDSNDLIKYISFIEDIVVDFKPDAVPELSKFTKCEVKELCDLDELIQKIIGNKVHQNPLKMLWDFSKKPIG